MLPAFMVLWMNLLCSGVFFIMATYKKVCENCKKEFDADRPFRKFCSMKCRIVPTDYELVGETFGWLTVIKEVECRRKNNGQPIRRFECKCKCGKSVIKNFESIKNKRLVNPSCGCFMSYHATHNRIKHGMSKTKIYMVWAQLKDRCYDETNPSFPKYGAKGVGVCERWEKFENFFADMGGSYKEGLTLDRYPNQKGNYEPSNCRWATYKQQNRNLSSNRNLTVMGVTACVSEFAEVGTFTKGIIFHRLKKGWSDEDAVFGKDEKIREQNISLFKKYYNGKSDRQKYST